ncbi:MAG: DUF2220 family protein [Actinomycetia bacterium]|nr:DUF2220 family protein [Actinomycetes bacterium]
MRRRWDDGTILRALAADEPFPVIEVPLRSPKPAEIGDDLPAARQWSADLVAGGRGGAAYTLRRASVGGRLIGRNELPARAIVDSYTQAAALLNVADEVRAYRAVRAAVAEEPVLASWVAGHPMRALSTAADWPGLLAAYRWLRAARGSGRYLREITAPGVDTKFVERHRALLAQLLDAPSAADGFLAALGLRGKPRTVRIRPDPALGVATGFSDLAVPVDELVASDPPVRSALVVENEITFLSAPVPAGGIVLWGKGFAVEHVGGIDWLADIEVGYWGDLDTHGFAILNQLRASLPNARSLLMDRRTLLAHRERWVTEASPAAARLDRLTTPEQDLYQDLVTDRLGPRIRLEQERIDWSWAARQLPS